MTDPNDSEVYIKCDATDTPASIASDCSVGNDGIEIFNPDTCSCEAVQECPDCNFIPGDNTDCPK